ncbi:MAG: Phage terminase, small subunit [Massilibacillus sp.]|nr:Phage terminase, small subunit [Massilibacillus sp.]
MALDIDNKTKSKQYYKAYIDYQIGNYTYEQLAKKYKVSPASVNSWRTRYWSKWDAMQNEQTDNATMQNTGDIMQGNADVTQEHGVRLDISRTKEMYVPIVTKQINDTNPALVYESYSRDNLPEISDREARFVEEFLIDLNKQDAAIRAGYSVQSAASLGSRLYDRPDVNAHIQVALAERRKRSGINADTTLRELGRIALANPARIVGKDGSILESASDDDLAAIQSIKVKVTPCKGGGEITEREVKFHDKTKAIELYMKASGMLVDKKEINITNKVELMSDEDRRNRIKQLQEEMEIDASYTEID